MSKIPLYNEIKDKIYDVLQKEIYQSRYNVLRVSIEIEEHITTQSIIDKLIEKESLNDKEEYTIMNVLYNLGFNNYHLMSFSYFLQYDNPIHIGILLNILIYSKHNVLEPFFPIQNYPSQDCLVEKIQEELCKTIVNTLKKTKQ
jgi:hypothetical protein